mmetsp:Transcript_1094/g.2228  ORF Transcript_1094/g.2228 Transcript_1094/m.2228 type:complete len:84 (+) Transcript_1094:873-1124(+)
MDEPRTTDTACISPILLHWRSSVTISAPISHAAVSAPSREHASSSMQRLRQAGAIGSAVGLTPACFTQHCRHLDATNTMVYGK